MLKWYKDEKLEVSLSHVPYILERYICPSCTEEEKKDIKKKPYRNINELDVEVKYKNLAYSFTIPKNFCFDGASIPRIFWRLIGSNTDNTFLVAAMIHDYMCEHHEVVSNNRYLSTLIFNALLEVGGVSSFKRWMMKHAVDNFQKFKGWNKK